MERRRESELVRAAGDGDREAAERLVESTYRQTYASLYRLCGGDADLAADLTQETYRKAWKSLGGFRGGSRVSTWLYRIAYNTFLNHVRRPRPVTDLDPEQEARLVEEGPGPEALAAFDDESERLRRAVLELPDDLRFTVGARFWQGLSVREIAEHEGVTTVAIRKRLAKAFQILRLHLEEVS